MNGYIFPQLASQIAPAADGQGWAVKAVKAMPVGIEPCVLSFMTSLSSNER